MHEDVVAESTLRNWPPSTYADRVRGLHVSGGTQERGSMTCILPETSTCILVARGELMNRDLLWQFMDVQTRLITPIRPHYAEYILGRRFLRRMVMPLKQDGPRLMCLILLLN